MTGLALITYTEACQDQNLFGPWFDGPSWSNWRVIDKAIFGEPLNADELAIFRELTGRGKAPDRPMREAWLAFGRKTAKTLKTASYGTYLATIGAEVYGYRDHLARGERGVVQILAVDRDQAGICLEYVRSFFEMPMLAAMVKRETADTIELANSLMIEITTNDKRRVRGRTVIAAILDEVAHWRSDNSANPDEVVFQAIKPSMVTIPNALLIGISSPYARKGLLWRKVNELYGKSGRTLIARAPTWVMNPTLPRDHEDIEEAYARDPSWAASEYGAEWRVDVESFVSREAIEACVDVRVFERGPLPNNRYFAFCDPSSGSADSMTLGIAHRENEIAILDCLREVQPQRGRTFSPEAVVADFCDVLKRYGITKVQGDKYALEWVGEPFRKSGITYDATAKPKTDLYRDLLPAINSGKVRLLDNKRLVNQLLGLERTIAKSGRDTISHANFPGAHDDCANAVAGALLLATAKKGELRQGTCLWALPAEVALREAAARSREHSRVTIKHVTELEDLKSRGLA